MPRRKKQQDLNDALKSIGVVDAKHEGGRAELYIDPSKLPAAKRQNIAAGLSKAGAVGFEKTNATFQKLNNDPLTAYYFEGPYSTGETFNARDKMRLAMRYFDADPLAGKIIEIMKVFSNDGFKNEHPNAKIKKFYDDWNHALNMQMVRGWMFLEYFRSGNVISLRKMVNVKDPGNPFKWMAPQYSVDGARAAELNDLSDVIKGANAARKFRFSKRMIPGAYTIINPLIVRVKTLNGYIDNLSLVPKRELAVNRIADDETFEAISRNLNTPNVKRILRMRQPYEPYGKVLMERAFPAIHEKNKLRQMDLTMMNSMMNQIVKVTIGNDEYPATPRQLKLLAQAFQNSGNSNTIFWNHTLNVEVIRPDPDILNKEKYERVNEDIRNAFGISEILTGGGGSKTNFATAFLSLKTFLANLKEAREDILRWYRGEYQDIAEAMGFDSYPEPSFNPLSLTDEIGEKQIIISLIDRGIISYQSAQSRLGYDPEIEVDRRKKEKPLVATGVLGPSQTFLASMNKEITDTDEEVNDKIEKDKNKETETMDQKKVQKNRRNSKKGNPPNVKGPDNKPAELKSKNKKLVQQERALKGKNGRPKTPKGKGMPNRKTAKIKGAGSKHWTSEQETIEKVVAEMAPKNRKKK